jgi:hypothetical protein
MMIPMTKQQSDYAPHDADNLNEGWTATREYLNDAILIAHDGCHKIYLAMDETEAEWFRENPYENMVEAGSQTPDAMYELLGEWWDASCSLRFISAVWHNEDEPNDGFVHLISQFAGDKNDDEPNDDEID